MCYVGQHSALILAFHTHLSHALKVAKLADSCAIVASNRNPPRAAKQRVGFSILHVLVCAVPNSSISLGSSKRVPTRRSALSRIPMRSDHDRRVEDIVIKWRNSRLPEKSAYQSHFNDLC